MTWRDFRIAGYTVKLCESWKIGNSNEYNRLTVNAEQLTVNGMLRGVILE
jgi:hypothetical protein